MKKSTKGAVAAAASGVLLLGGAGSLAFWSDSDIIGGGTINAGHISLDDTTLGSNPDPLVTTDDGCANAPFILDAGESGATVFGASSHLVPGDVLTKICTFNVNASGDHLRATLAATGGAGTGALAAETTTGAAFTVANVTQTTLTQADNGSEVKATITVTFPYGAATNNSQDDQLNVGAYTIALTQVHGAPVAP